MPKENSEAKVDEYKKLFEETNQILNQLNALEQYFFSWQPNEDENIPDLEEIHKSLDNFWQRVHEIEQSLVRDSEDVNDPEDEFTTQEVKIKSGIVRTCVLLYKKLHYLTDIWEQCWINTHTLDPLDPIPEDTTDGRLYVNPAYKIRQ